MTTPNTKSYNEARWVAIKKFETTGKPDTAFYLDGSGFVTIGYGTLVTKNGATDPNAKAVVSNSSDGLVLPNGDFEDRTQTWYLLPQLQNGYKVSIYACGKT